MTWTRNRRPLFLVGRSCFNFPSISIIIHHCIVTVSWEPRKDHKDVSGTEQVPKEVFAMTLCYCHIMRKNWNCVQKLSLEGRPRVKAMGLYLRDRGGYYPNLTFHLRYGHKTRAGKALVVRWRSKDRPVEFAFKVNIWLQQRSKPWDSAVQNSCSQCSIVYSLEGMHESMSTWSGQRQDREYFVDDLKMETVDKL